MIEFGPFHYDPKSRLLYRDGEEIVLPPRVLELLEALLERSGEVVPKEDLLDSVWQDAFVGESSLTSAISKLREALDDDAREPRYVQTIPRRGYRFIAEVAAVRENGEKQDRAAADPSTAGREAEQSARGASSVEPRSAEPDPVRRSRSNDTGREAEETREERGPSGESGQTSMVAARRRGWRASLSWILVAVLAVALAIAVGMSGSDSEDAAPERVRHLPLHVGAFDSAHTDRYRYRSVALSPDGNRLAIVRDVRDERARTGWRRTLLIQSLERLESRTLVEDMTGRLDPADPFFSPDGRWVGFFTEDTLKKISVDGGDPVTLCAVQDSWGGSWGPDGTIIFSPGDATGLARVSSRGGEPEMITVPDSTVEDASHRWPQILPGGKLVLFTAGSAGRFAEAKIMAVSLETGEIHTVQRDAMFARHASSGHLLFMRRSTLLAARFDTRGDRPRLTGQPVPVLENIVSDTRFGRAAYSVSHDGALAYLLDAETTERNTIQWADEDGGISALISEPDVYLSPSLSPDGRSLAVSVGWPLEETDIWVRDLQRATLSRLTSDRAGSVYPTWSPDGRWVAYGAIGDQVQVSIKRADGSGEARVIGAGLPMDWSPDGRALAIVTTQSDIEVLRFAEQSPDREAPEVVARASFMATEFHENYPSFSPDGRWIVYVSDESRRTEVYVRPYPGPGTVLQISPAGGTLPVWPRAGDEIFYLSGARIMAVPYDLSGGSFTVGAPRTAVRLPVSPADSVPRFWHALATFDVAVDSRRFVVLQSRPSDRSANGPQLMIALRWLRELDRLTG